jgi:hypothetical protein
MENANALPTPRRKSLPKKDKTWHRWQPPSHLNSDCESDQPPQKHWHIRFATNPFFNARTGGCILIKKTIETLPTSGYDQIPRKAPVALYCILFSSTFTFTSRTHTHTYIECQGYFSIQRREGGTVLLLAKRWPVAIPDFLEIMRWLHRD